MSEDRKPSAKNFVEGVFKAENSSAASIEKGKLNKYNNIAIKMFHTGVLTPKEMIYPAIAQFATKLLKGVQTYRTLYFVNVLKIDMSYVTLILTLIGIYDILNNPIMGALYDRTRTRWGKARPYVMFAAFPYFISTALLYSGALFLGDTSGNDARKIVFVFVMLFIQETFSTIYSIPRDNMLTLQTANPKDRITVGLLNTYIGEAGSQLVYLIFLPLMELYNKGYSNISMPIIFAILAGVTSVIGAGSNVAMAIGCKERIALQEKPAPLTKSLFYILKNKYQLRNFIASFLTSWWADGGYSWDVVTQQEIFGGSIPSFIAYMPYNALDTISITFIPKFQKIFKNNKQALIVLRMWDLFCCAGMMIFGLPVLGTMNAANFKTKRWLMVLVYGIFYGINAINNGPANVFESEIGREISDYTEYVTGERPDGTINILTDLITKVTSPINAALTIWLFKWSGYDSTLTMLPWAQNSHTVYQKVFFLFNGIHILPNVAKVVPYFFYDLVGEKREQMYIALNERRALIAKKDEETEALEAMVAGMEAEKIN